MICHDRYTSHQPMQQRDNCELQGCSNCVPLHHLHGFGRCNECQDISAGEFYGIESPSNPPAINAQAEATTSSSSWELTEQYTINFFTNDCSNMAPINYHLLLGNDDRIKAFTSVHGITRRGLLVDPGASKGLIGSEQLRLICDDVLVPNNMAHLLTWHPSTAKFSGISVSKSENSIGLVKFPIGLLGLKRAGYSADVIGGPASMCPGLIPLRTLMANGCLMACGFFPGGDGVLAIKVENQRWAAQRLLLTDSGHYLLPIDHFNAPSDPTLNKAAKQAGAAIIKSISHNGSNNKSNITSTTFDHDSDTEQPAHNFPVVYLDESDYPPAQTLLDFR